MYGMHHGLQMEARGQMCGVGFPSTCARVPGIEFR